MITLIQAMISTGAHMRYNFYNEPFINKRIHSIQIGHKFESTETINITLEPGIW